MQDQQNGSRPSRAEVAARGPFTTDSLVGSYCLAGDAIGVVVAKVSPGHYLIEFTGLQRVVAAADMPRWKFFDTREKAENFRRRRHEIQRARREQAS